MNEKLNLLPDEVFQDNLVNEKGSELKARGEELRDWVYTLFPDEGMESGEVSKLVHVISPQTHH